MTEPDADGDSARDGSDDSADGSTSTDASADSRTAENDGIEARYRETESERLLVFERVGGGAGSSGTSTATAAIAQNTEGYAMLKVRPTADGDELERYYGFDMALDHAAELLGASPHDLPVPKAAEDLGM